MQGLNKEATKKELNRILGSAFNVKEYNGGLKATIPTLNATQMGGLVELYEGGSIKDVTIKRSGTMVTLFVDL